MDKTTHQQTPHNALNYLFRWQIASSFYMSVLQLLSIILLGRFLGYKELGIYTIFQLIFRMAVALFEPGMFVSIIQKNGFNKSILRRENKIQTIILCAGLILLLVFFVIEKNYLYHNTNIVLIAILLFSSIGLFSKYPAILTFQLKQKEISLAQMAGSSIEFIFIISTIWFVSPILIFSCALLIRFIIYYALCSWYLKRSEIQEVQNASIDEHVRFSGFQILNQGLSFVQGNFDTVLVGSVFGLSVLGPYNFASELSYLLFSKLNPVFNKAIFPVLSKFKDVSESRQNIISESLLSHALICISLYLILYFNIQKLIPIVAKDPEGLIALYSKYILVMAIIRSVSNMIFNQLLALGESRNLLKWNIIVLLINYTFVAVMYFSHSAIQLFLLLNIFLSFSVMIYIVYKLKNYYSDQNLFKRQILNYLGFLMSCSVVLFCLQLLELHFIISILLDTLILVILSYTFYKIKLLKLFKFRIM